MLFRSNTGAFVVTVDDAQSGITSNMMINETFNAETLKLAGGYVDAEHDVFYYLEGEGGFDYTFSPEGVSSVTIAYPVVGEQSATYAGFVSEGVISNEDGSYVVRLKHGRNIVKLTNASGVSEYQILTAKPAKYTIANGTNPGEPFQPGEIGRASCRERVLRLV